MSVQQDLLKKFGDSLVLKFRANIESVKASGKTAASIHAVTTEYTLEVLASRHIWALEEGRKPTGSGATRGNPSLFEQIKEWALIRGIITNVNDRKQLGVVYSITRKIHNEGWKARLNKPLSSVIESIDLDMLLRNIVEAQSNIYETIVTRELKDL